MKPSTKTISRIFIAIIVVLSAIISYNICSRLLPSSDDLFYHFIFDDNDFEDASAIRPLTSWHDLTQSQQWHYMHVNGRAPVHILVQAFAGLWGMKAFAVVNALIFALFLCLVVRIAFPSRARTNPLSWLFTLLSLLYLFPGGLNSVMGPWFGIAIGINYLWAGTMFLAYILIFNRYSDHDSHIKPLTLIILSLLGLFTGWSNEAYALPLSGAALFYILTHRRKLNTPIITLTLTLWIGTALLVFAPGTLHRASSQSGDGISSLLISLVDCYLTAWPVWIALIIALYATITHRIRWREFAARHFIIVTTLLLALPFSVFAHTYPHSITEVTLLSFILSVLLIYRLLPSLNRVATLATFVVAPLIIALIVWHQTAISNATDISRSHYLQTVNDFRHSPDGVIVTDYPDYGALIDPFVYKYQMHLRPGSTYPRPLAAWSGRTDVLPLELTAEQFDALIASPQSFFNSHTPMPGTAGMYEVGNFYIRPIDSIGDVSQSVVITASFGADFMQSLPFYKRWAYAIMGSNKKPKQLNTFTLHTRAGDYLVALRPTSTPNRIDIATP